MILLIEGRCHNLVECLPEFIERTKVRKSTRQSFGSLDPQVVLDKLFFMRSEYTTVCKTNHGPVPQVPPGPRRYAPLFGSRGALHDAIQDLVQLAKLDPVGLGPWLLGNRLFECLLAEPPPSPLHIQAGGRVCGGSLCRRHAPLCVRFRVGTVLTDGHLPTVMRAQQTAIRTDCSPNNIEVHAAPAAGPWAPQHPTPTN